MTSVLGSHREGPCFSNQGLRLGPVVEKAKGAHTLSCIIQNQLAMTRGILSHKGQPCPTNNDVMDHVTRYCNVVGLHCRTRLVYTIHQTVPSLVECLACEATVAQVFVVYDWLTIIVCMYKAAGLL